MGKQINQYTKTRTSGTVKPDDLMDLDSTEDSGSTFESAKITVANFLAYLNGAITNIYNANSTILADRTLTALTRFTRWLGGNVEVMMSDEINDYAFIVRDSSGTEVARIGYDQGTLSGKMSLQSATGEFITALDDVFKVTGQMYSDLPAVLSPLGTSQLIDWNDGNGQVINLDNATGNVTLSDINPKAGATYVLKIIQATASIRDLNYPGNWKWSNGGVDLIPTSTFGAEDMIILFYDGTNYLASFNQNFA